jgi:hypothetical protein
MQSARVIQILWAVGINLFLLTAVDFKDFADASFWNFAETVLTVAYLLAAIGCFFNHRPSWAFAALYPLVPLATYGPTTCRDFYITFTGQEPDFPVVRALMALTMGILFVIPPLLIYLNLYFDRVQLLNAIRPSATPETKAPSVESHRNSNPYVTPRN